MKKVPFHMMVSVAGWLISALAILGFATLAQPDAGRSQYFWARLVWAELLVALIWCGVGGFVRSTSMPKADATGGNGLAPGLCATIVLYSVASLLLMLFQSFFPDREVITRLHWIGQIVLLLGVGVALVFFNVARFAAASGSEPIPEGIRSPVELCALLRQEEVRFGSNADSRTRKCVPEKLKVVREGIQFSIPHVGSIGTLPDYVNFAESVEQICKSLSAHNPAIGFDEDHLQKLENELIEIQSKTTYIASVLRR